MVISVPDVEYNPQDMFAASSLPTVTPEEDRLAFVGAWARYVINFDMDRVTAWIACSQHVTFRFIPAKSQYSGHFENLNLRDAAVKRGLALQRTPFGWLVEILTFKKTVEEAEGRNSSADINGWYQTFSQQGW